MEFESICCGVECIVRVTHWEPYRPAFISGPPEDCYPSEGGEGDWELLDENGNPAPWLEEKMDATEARRIGKEVYRFMEGR